MLHSIDIQIALDSLKKNKACGEDGIPAELINHFTQNLFILLQQLLKYDKMKKKCQMIGKLVFSQR